MGVPLISGKEETMPSFEKERCALSCLGKVEKV